MIRCRLRRSEAQKHRLRRFYKCCQKNKKDIGNCPFPQTVFSWDAELFLEHIALMSSTILKCRCQYRRRSAVVTDIYEPTAALAHSPQRTAFDTALPFYLEGLIPSPTRASLPSLGTFLSACCPWIPSVRSSSPSPGRASKSILTCLFCDKRQQTHLCSIHPSASDLQI